MNKLQHESAGSPRTPLLPALMLSVSLAVAGCTATPPREQPARDVRTSHDGRVTTVTEYCYNPTTGFNETRVSVN